MTSAYINPEEQPARMQYTLTRHQLDMIPQAHSSFERAFLPCPIYQKLTVAAVVPVSVSYFFRPKPDVFLASSHGFSVLFTGIILMQWLAACGRTYNTEELGTRSRRRIGESPSTR